MDRRKMIVLLFVCDGLVAFFRLMATSDIYSRYQAKQCLYVVDLSLLVARLLSGRGAES